MKFKKAIIQARKHKCKLKNEGFKVQMCDQSAKDLIHWLFTFPIKKKKSRKIFEQWINSTTWELDFDCKRKD